MGLLLANKSLLKYLKRKRGVVKGNEVSLNDRGTKGQGICVGHIAYANVKLQKGQKAN